MTGGPGPHSEPGGQNGPAQPRQDAGGWHGAGPEVAIAAAVAACAAAAGYGAGGLPAMAIVMTVAAVAALAVIRFIGSADDAPPTELATASTDTGLTPGEFSGYWRKRAGIFDATQSLSAYDTSLRTTLQHLLAARLAERHGISLSADPQAARRLMFPRERDARLWYWIDPQRPATVGGTQRGIPPRVLSMLIERLERL